MSEIELANGSKIPRVKGIGGARIHVPDGLTVVEYIQKGIDLQHQGKLVADIVKELGIGNDTYNRCRNIILLSQREDLNPKDVAIIAEAINELETYRQVQKPWQKVKSIADRVDMKKGEHRSKQFDNAISYLVHTCETAENVEIPHISYTQAEEAVRLLFLAEASLSKIRQSIMEAKYGRRQEAKPDDL